jgi:hypothetical protein
VIKRTLATAAVIAVLLALRLYLSSAGSTPPGQPPLAILNDAGNLKDAFNRDLGRMRAIILLSPSCPYCLKGATGIQRILGEHPSSSLTAFVVWMPILGTDWGKPRSGPLGRLKDARVQQFWDADHRIAEALRHAHEGRSQLPNCCYEDGIWWDLMAVYAPGVRWEEKLPEPLLLEGTVEEAAPAFENLLKSPITKITKDTKNTRNPACLACPARPACLMCLTTM